MRWLGLALLVGVGLAFAPALAGGFVWDDVILIRDNPAVHDLGAAWAAAWSDFFGHAVGQPQGGYLRPVPTLLNAATWAAVGPSPWVFHAQNLALHLAAVALLVGLARQLGASPLAALAAGALFGVHPRQVEAVAFISGRTDLLAAVGVLLAARLHVHARRAGGWGAVWGAWAALALAVLSKEVALVWPLALLALEGSGQVAPDGHRRRALFGGYVTLVAAAVAVRLAVGIGAASRLYFEAGDAPVAALSLVGRYGALLGAPESRALYDHWPVASVDGWTAAGAALLVVGGILAWRLRRDPLLGFGLIVAGLCLAPVLHLVPIPALAAERYLYLPLAGLGLVIAGVVDWGGRRTAMVVAALALVGAAQAADRSLDWRSEVELWGAEVTRPEASYKAWQNLAVTLAERGQWADASVAIQQAQRRAPGDGRVFRNAVRIVARECPAWAGRRADLAALLQRPVDAARLQAVRSQLPCAPVARLITVYLEADQGR